MVFASHSSECWCYSNTAERASSQGSLSVGLLLGKVHMADEAVVSATNAGRRFNYPPIRGESAFVTRFFKLFDASEAPTVPKLT